MSEWERRRILVWGKTRPEVSRNYRETVCTGGVFEDTRRLVRLYPIPLRYLNDEQYFQKYQWIEADVQRNPSDPRPESYRIRAQNIRALDRIDTSKDGTWRERATWVLGDANVFRSVEALQARQAIDHTSLGIVTPKKIVQIHADTFDPKEKREFWSKYRAVTDQLLLGLDDDLTTPVRPLTPPDYKFLVRFTCDDPACTLVHKFGVLDWEVDALYFNMKKKYGDVAAKGKVLEHLTKILMGPESDPRFFLGNISNHPTNFTIVGLWYPKKSNQPSLLDADA